MVGKLTVAFVNFFREARGRKVVDISKIVGFAPITHTDFNEDATYGVKWPHFPSEGSFSSEGVFDAKILFLGVDLKDLQNEASMKGLKIPSSLVENEHPTSSKNSKKTTKKPIVGPDPPLAYKLPCGDEELNVMCDEHSDDGESDHPPACKLRKKKLKLSEKVTMDRMSRAPQGNNTRKQSQSSNIKVSSPSEPHLKVNKESPSKRSKSRTKKSRLDPPLKLDKGSTKQSEQCLDLMLPTHQEALTLLKECPPMVDDTETARKLRSKECNLLAVESDSSNSSASWQPDQVKNSNINVDMYVQKILRLETELKKANRENIALSEKLAKNDDEKNQLMALNFQLQLRVFNADNAETPKATPSTQKQALKLFSDEDEDKVPGAKRKLPFFTPSPKRTQVVSPVTPGYSSLQITPESSQVTQDTLNTTPESTHDMYASHMQLAPIIYDALVGKTPLRSDGAGKIHLGNNVWVSSSIFEEKLAKAKVEPSIAVRDAMTHIYTVQQMSDRSLEGGAPVKGDKTKKKAKMTPHKREALLALHRAKSMVKSTDEAFLELVGKKAKATIRDRLKEAANTQKTKPAESHQPAPFE